MTTAIELFRGSSIAPNIPIDISRDEPEEFKLFPFQEESIKQIYGHIRSNVKHILYVACTGSGKTAIAATIFRDATIRAKNPLRCVFLVDLNCLIPQSIEEFRSHGVNCASLQGSRSKSKKARQAIEQASVIVASIQTLEARRKRRSMKELLGGDVGLIVADEVHTTGFSKVYSQLREEFSVGTVFLGLTATPRTESSQRYLGRFFDKVVAAPSMREMIRLGRCVPARCFSPSGIFDVSRLGIDEKTGDYDEYEQARQIVAGIPSIIRNWQEKAENRSTVAYCPRVAIAKLLAQKFCGEGIVAEWQDGSTPMGVDGKSEHDAGRLTRAAQNYRLDNGITKVVCSVGTMTKGWSLRSLGCVMMVRATRSLRLFIQCVGRGARTCKSPYWADGMPKQNYILLDFGENLNFFKRRGFSIPNGYGDRPWYDYWIGEKSPSTELKTKICPQCEKELPVFSRVCSCGYEFGGKDIGDEVYQAELEIELYEWFDDVDQKQVLHLRDCKKRCFELEESPEKAVKIFKKRYGFIPPGEWHYAAIFGSHPTKDDRANYYKYLKQFAPHDYWINAQMSLEFGSGKGEGRRKKSIKTKASKKECWWVVLGVAKNCDRATAKRAYQSLAKEWHPDICDDEMALQVMQKINNAWDEAVRFFG